MYTTSLLDAKSAGVDKVADNLIDKSTEVSILAAEELHLLAHVAGHGLCTVVNLKFDDAGGAPTLMVKPMQGDEAIEVAEDSTTVIRHNLPLSPNDKVDVMVSVDGYITSVFIDKEADGKDDVVYKLQEAVTWAMDRAGEPDINGAAPKTLLVDLAVRDKDDGHNIFYCHADLGLFYSPWSAAETIASLLKLS